MQYYKIKVKTFASGKEAWIAFKADGVQDAMRIAMERCDFTRDIFYPMEQYLQEVSLQEYLHFTERSKTSISPCD